MVDFETILSGSDLRSIGKANYLVPRIKNQIDFDKLFACLYHPDRIVVMRAADAIEKLTSKDAIYLGKHEKKILELCSNAKNKELVWHLALMLPRLALNKEELHKSRDILIAWIRDKSNSRIVRVNAIQALYELAIKEPELMNDLNRVIKEIKKENIPSINARLRKLNLSNK
jgi:hypothetical protein